MDMFLEIRKRLQNALLIIREPKQGSLPVDVSITPSVLKMKTLEQCREINFPPEVRLVPSSLRGLQYVSGDGIHMRLLVQADLNKKLVSTLNQSLETPKCYVFYCQSCGEIILKERKLLRVLPLPSGNWNALVEEWCCHPDPFSNKPLNPGVNDCFIGDTHLLVNLRSDSCAPGPEIAQVEIHQPSESYLESKPKANTKIICKRCKAMLGESGSSGTVLTPGDTKRGKRLLPANVEDSDGSINSGRSYLDGKLQIWIGTTKFYITEIIIQPSGRDFDMIPRSQFVQSVIAQCLVELSSARSTFRFTVQGHDGKTYILLWLLNSDSLLIECLRNSKNFQAFSLFEGTERLDSNSVGIWNVVKVLFHPCTKNRNNELASSWENDIGVHSLVLPSQTCLELLLILSRSNDSLPPSLQYMNSFQSHLGLPF
ncbi:E3 ubiquitin-protein ligase E3D isoform X2 [Notamacropus eugenii]|uniref:E3 ubiquitin-protein ligase E3D isoform X2 n=1 Tax=Notamacropus eugenii TaxID=9315 RepID=UPI003B66E008